MPFLTDHIYQHLKSLETVPVMSIHLCQYPEQSADLSVSEKQLLCHIEIFKDVLTKARSARSKSGLAASTRKPIKKLYIGHTDASFLTFVEQFKDTLYSEVNCLEIELGHVSQYVTYRGKLNMKALSSKYKHHMKYINDLLVLINQDQRSLTALHVNGEPLRCLFRNEELVLTSNELSVIVEPTMSQSIISVMENNLIVGVDLSRDEDMTKVYLVRQFCIIVQALRKKCNIHPWDVIDVYYDCGPIGCLFADCHTKLKCDIHWKKDTTTPPVGSLLGQEDAVLHNLDGDTTWPIHVELRH
jgi:isoleucyl-tRNA synthetase